MCEPYLKQVNKMNIRRALTKMRISANNLEIETGRYANKTYNEEFINRNERYCTLCKERGENIVADEIHVALHCKSFDNQREKLIKNFNEKTKKTLIAYLIAKN